MIQNIAQIMKGYLKLTLGIKKIKNNPLILKIQREKQQRQEQNQSTKADINFT
jgi:hypothetical protein